MNKLNPSCDFKLSDGVICPHSEYGKYALEHHLAGFWCAAICHGDNRAYKLDDGETHWYYGPSAEWCKKEHLDNCGGEYEIISIEPEFYASDPFITLDEVPKRSIKLSDLLLTDEIKDKPQLVASSVW